MKLEKQTEHSSSFVEAIIQILVKKEKKYKQEDTVMCKKWF